MTQQNLPELPAPFCRLQIDEYGKYVEAIGEVGISVFDAEQMHAYALAALSSQGAGEAVARVELMETGGNAGIATRIVEIDDPLRERLRAGDLLYTSPQAAQPARVVDALRGAIERMDRARSILTGGKPSPECNWGMLDTSDLVGALSTPPAAPTTSQQAGEVTELELFEEWIEQEAGKGALKKWPNEHGTSYENLRVCDYRTGWLAALAAFEAKKASQS